MSAETDLQILHLRLLSFDAFLAALQTPTHTIRLSVLRAANGLSCESRDNPPAFDEATQPGSDE